jgi:hypothetical protein
MLQFFESMSNTYRSDVVKAVRDKSLPWDDGYSSAEMHQPVNYANVRFNVEQLRRDIKDKTLVFVPNRVGGRGRSSDYTNCGKFLFDVVPEIWKKRRDFTIIAGNPNQKFNNDELVELCPAVMKVVPDALNRDEYKVIAKMHDISVGLFNVDTFGGTSSRELLDIGSIPFWVDNYEYSSIAKTVNWPNDLMTLSDLSDIAVKFETLLDWYQQTQQFDFTLSQWHEKFRDVVRKRCSYEITTKEAMKIMNLL